MSGGNSELLNKESLINFFNSKCNVSLPCSRILACLVAEKKPLKAKDIHRYTGIIERKVYSYLDELIDLGVVNKSMGYPTHYKSISLNELINVLTLRYKQNLERQIESMMEEAEKIKNGLPTMDQESTFLRTPSLLYSAFYECLRSLVRGEEMIVETKSSLVLAVPEYEFETMLKNREYESYSLAFRNLLGERLGRREIVAKYVCNINSFLGNLGGSEHIKHRLNRLETLRSNIQRLTPNLQIANTDLFIIGLPATTIFGQAALAFSLKEIVIGELSKYSTDRLVRGILIKNQTVVRSFHKILNEYFEQIKLENINDYFQSHDINKRAKDLNMDETVEYLAKSSLDKINEVIKNLEGRIK